MIVIPQLVPKTTNQDSTRARQLSPARTPVREAFERWTRDSMPPLYSARANAVAECGEPEIRQICEPRLFEPVTACLSPERMPQVELESRYPPDDLRGRRDHVNGRHFLQIDRAFHQRVSTNAPNPYLLGCWGHIRTLMLWLSNSDLPAHGARGNDLLTHESTVEEIVRREGTVVAAMRDHIFASKDCSLLVIS
jgi:DNA-binding GntR family transcriptional regulator